MSKEWEISYSQKQHFTTNLAAGEIQEDQLKDGQTRNIGTGNDV
jgi:hypothetical protein